MNNQLFKFAELYDQGGDLNKRWYVGYYFLHPESQKFQFFRYKYISKKHITKRSRRNEALRLINDCNNKLRSGYNPFTTSGREFRNIIAVLDEALKIKEAYTRRRTIISNKSYIKKFNEWLSSQGLDSLYIESFTHLNAQEFCDHLKRQGLGNRTHNNYLRALRAIFTLLLDRGYIYANPFRKVKYLPLESKRPVVYTPDELELLSSNCPGKDPELWIVCQFIYYCALRPSEIVSLKIRNIDTAKEIIFIDGSASKNKTSQAIRIPEAFLTFLKELDINKMRQDYYLISKDLKPGAIKIFPTRLSERFRKLANTIDLNRTLYELKHTAIAQNLANGANIYDIQRHCRHYNINQTEEYLKALGCFTSQEFIKNYPLIDF